MRYTLRDDGYASLQWIIQTRKKIGRVVKNADGSFTGIIRGFSATGSSWDDAKNQVVAEVEGCDVSELTGSMVSVRPVQERTKAILAWLTNHAASNGGHLHFNNTDLAVAAGWQRPNQALGNLVSRLDLCCFKAGLPSIGCAAEATFKNAWQDSYNHPDWSFPVERMQLRARQHHWTRTDFELLQQESLGLLVGSAHLAWLEVLAKHEARLKEWSQQ